MSASPPKERPTAALFLTGGASMAGVGVLAAAAHTLAEKSWPLLVAACGVASVPFLLVLTAVGFSLICDKSQRQESRHETVRTYQ